MESLEKLYAGRAKLLTDINKYAKNLTDSCIYYIHGNTIYAESYGDSRFQGVFKVEGFDLSMLYLDETKWYRVNGAKLATVLKKKPITVEIQSNIIKVSSSEGNMKIKPCKDNSKKLYEFLNILEKYNMDDTFYYNDITETICEALDRTLPLIMNLRTNTDEYKNIRFVKKMIKTNYKRQNIVSAMACLNYVTEQVYICKLEVTKLDGTKTKPLHIKITHLYGTVPF